MFSLKHIENQSSIGIWIRFLLTSKETRIIVHFQLRLDRLGSETRAFDICLHIDRFVGLHPHDYRETNKIWTVMRRKHSETHITKWSTYQVRFGGCPSHWRDNQLLGHLWIGPASTKQQESSISVENMPVDYECNYSSTYLSLSFVQGLSSF